MPNRTATFVSALFAGVLAGIPLATISNGAAVAAGDCLSEPKGGAPDGSHWYYRVEHPSNRHCWYLRPEGGKPSQITARPAPPKAEPAMQRSVAEAHAELPRPQTRVEPETDLTAGPPVAPLFSNAVSPQNNRPANAGSASPPPSAVVSRWPEPLGVSSSAPPPAAGNPGANMASVAPATQPPAAAAIPLAAADSPFEKQSRSTVMLLIAVAGALSFAGFMGRAIFRFGGIRPAERPPTRGSRREIWDSIVVDPPFPSAAANHDARISGVRLPRDPRAADDPNRRVTEMLARLARSAAT